MSKNHYKNISEINEKLLKSQENYYTMLLQKDKDTIKFRHDTAEHINCMYSLFEHGKYDDLREYFGKIGASLSELRPKIQTGNDMLSAILNDSVNKYPSVEYEIEGKMPNETALSNMDICTIFSNLFDNAFSAATKSKEKLVTVSFRFIGENFFCKVMNTIDHKVNVVNNMLVTEKNDKHFLYHDENDRKTQKCKIRYSLKNDKRNIKSALRYLCCYSYYFGEGNDEERRPLWETIITALAEMVENDSVKIGGRTVMYYEIIDRLNEIIENSYLSECFIGFEEHWQTLITEKKITYPKAYMKSCLWNWLCNFEFEDFNDYAKMKDL